LPLIFNDGDICKKINIGNMKKLLLVLLAAALSVSSALAENSHEGFFAQVGIGYQSLSPTSNNLTETFTGDPTAYPVTASISKINTFTQALSAGYLHKLDKDIYLGLGLDYNPIPTSSANVSQTLFYNGVTGSSNATYQASNSYNLYLTPAYVIGDAGLGYLKLGYSATQVKITSGSGSIQPGNANSYNLNGYILGVGYKQYLAGNIYGFVEGNYNGYKNINISTTSCVDYCGTTTGNIGLSSYSFLTGVGYKF
jgi:hypothetical protein